MEAWKSFLGKFCEYFYTFSGYTKSLKPNWFYQKGISQCKRSFSLGLILFNSYLPTPYLTWQRDPGTDKWETFFKLPCITEVNINIKKYINHIELTCSTVNAVESSYTSAAVRVYSVGARSSVLTGVWSTIVNI